MESLPDRLPFPLGPTIATSAMSYPVRTGAVYALVDAADPARVRYIGSTWDPAYRMQAHALHPQGERLRGWIRDVLARGGEILMREIATSTDRNILYEIEESQTDAYLRLGMADLNGAFTRASRSRTAA